jgi:uncharacterized protein (DUF58 family)
VSLLVLIDLQSNSLFLVFLFLVLFVFAYTYKNPKTIFFRFHRQWDVERVADFQLRKLMLLIYHLILSKSMENP